MSRRCPRRRAKGAAAMRNTRCNAGAIQAHSAALDRAGLSCGSPGITGLSGSCDTDRGFERLCNSIPEQPQPARLLVRTHLLSESHLHPSRPGLELALEWTRQVARDLDGWWWQPTDALPVMYVEAFATWGQA